MQSHQTFPLPNYAWYPFLLVTINATNEIKLISFLNHNAKLHRFVSSWGGDISTAVVIVHLRGLKQSIFWYNFIVDITRNMTYKGFDRKHVGLRDIES